MNEAMPTTYATTEAHPPGPSGLRNGYGNHPVAIPRIRVNATHASGYDTATQIADHGSLARPGDTNQSRAM